MGNLNGLVPPVLIGYDFCCPGITKRRKNGGGLTKARSLRLCFKDEAMRERPSPQLIAMLERLGLATAAQVERMEGRVRRLARDLPRFDCVWIDALCQARVLTPFQAAELNAGRGDGLRIGPYLLTQPATTCHFASGYRAERFDCRETVYLNVIDREANGADDVLGQLQSLVSASDSLPLDYLAPITDVGRQGNRLWAASRWTDGQTAAEWMIRHGRFRPDAVLTVARTMVSGLIALEKHGLCHGDISLSGIQLTASGSVALLQPGLRGIIRPEEGYARADLAPEAYDAMAPERVATGTRPTTASDIYACGCVWWHMLCGRPPLGGGDSLAKLRRAQEAAIGDVRQWNHEVADSLAAAIAACVQRDPQRRPQSMDVLASLLGRPARRARPALVRHLATPARPTILWTHPTRKKSRGNRSSQHLTAAARQSDSDDRHCLACLERPTSRAPRFA